MLQGRRRGGMAAVRDRYRWTNNHCPELDCRCPIRRRGWGRRRMPANQVAQACRRPRGRRARPTSTGDARSIPETEPPSRSATPAGRARAPHPSTPRTHRARARTTSGLWHDVQPPMQGSRPQRHSKRMENRIVSPICKAVPRSWEFRWGPVRSGGGSRSRYVWARRGPETANRSHRVTNPLGSATHLRPTALRLAFVSARAGARRGTRMAPESRGRPRANPRALHQRVRGPTRSSTSSGVSGTCASGFSIRIAMWACPPSEAPTDVLSSAVSVVNGFSDLIVVAGGSFKE